jgi:fructosamine-3-kinase
LEKKYLAIIQGFDNVISLLHGDLWAANVIGKFLIDPAVYFGHRESDLAMMLLFGGFDNLLKKYQEKFPLVENYHLRIDLYQLYHLMNHLNLFGPIYLSAVIKKMQKLLKPRSNL